MQSTLLCNPIGYFRCSDNKRYSLPKQPGKGRENHGIIVLNPHQNFEQALEDLSGFSRIWVLFWFHHNSNWKPKVLTPSMDSPKRGLFATRSPHRPNPIGLSCLEIVEIKNLHIYVSNHDLLDETPVLDIKPYVEYADSWPGASQGWLEPYKSPISTYDILWNTRSKEQLDYLEAQWKIKMCEEINFRLNTNPFPSKNNRISHLKGNSYQLAYKTWRVHFKIDPGLIEVLEISSGYNVKTLQGIQPSRWDDLEIHQAFQTKFFLPLRQ